MSSAHYAHLSPAEQHEYLGTYYGHAELCGRRYELRRGGRAGDDYEWYGPEGDPATELSADETVGILVAFGGGAETVAEAIAGLWQSVGSPSDDDWWHPVTTTSLASGHG